jgi:sorbose reductase
MIKVSRETNPLTAPLPTNNAQSPLEQAIARFTVSGNVIGAPPGAFYSIYAKSMNRSCFIVTGGAGELGREAVRALLQHGAKGLCIFDTESGFAVSRAALDALYAEFLSGAHTFLEEVVDVTDEHAVQHAVENTVEKLGSIDILVCLAGVAAIGKAEETTLETWNTVLSVNTTGSWLCAKAVGK